MNKTKLLERLQAKSFDFVKASDYAETRDWLLGKIQ